MNEEPIEILSIIVMIWFLGTICIILYAMERLYLNLRFRDKRRKTTFEKLFRR